MVLDIGLPDQHGLAFLESLPEGCRPPTLVITAHGELENTIHARKLGVLEFFPKPLDFVAFKAALGNLPRLGDSDESEERKTSAFIGAASAMRFVFQQIAHACASHVPVLLTGETGTGKSLAARLIQRDGMEDGRPAGTYHPTAADQVDGLTRSLKTSRGGSLLLEDIGALGQDAQAELLRQWEAWTEGFPRIVAVGNSDLRKEVERGTFRSDLFYRLQVLQIQMPPLRDRMEDLESLFAYFLAQAQPGRALQADQTVSDKLESYRWPGNLRELRNVASFAVTACSVGTSILPAHLPEYLQTESPRPTDKIKDSLGEALDQWLDRDEGLPAYRELAAELERQLLEKLLPRFDGKLARLAKELRANRSTLRKRLRR